MVREDEETELGKKLGEVRRRRGDSLAQLAKQFGVTKGYLSLVERGLKPVTPVLRAKYANAYKESTAYWDLIGGHKGNILESLEEGQNSMKQDALPSEVQVANQQLQVTLNPEKNPVLYSDHQIVTTNDGGIVINFGQASLPAPALFIAARIGMSHIQSKAFYDALGKELRGFAERNNMEL